MDEKELDQNEEFDLDSILNEFHDLAAENPEAGDAPDLSALLEGLNPEQEESESEQAPEVDSEAEETSEEESPDEGPTEEASEEETEESIEYDLTPDESLWDASGEEDLQENTEEASASDASLSSSEEEENADTEENAEAISAEDSEEPAEEAREEVFTEEDIGEIQEEDQQEVPAEPLVYDPQAHLRDLKRKLVAGPEKRYYALSELGVGKLQIAIFINVILVLLCAFGAVAFAAGKVPENRMRFLIFSQVLAMLISGLLGLNLMLDGAAELLKARFSINTMLFFTFLACIADAALCLKELRVPCCCAFCLQMTFALAARCQQRNTEMGQMDTLRKAVRLHSLKKVPDYYQGQSGLIRSEGSLEDFMDSYQKSSGPQKLQSFYAFFAFLLCIGISVLAGMMHGVSMALQILAVSMLAAVPASFFISLTRPAAILERRLHMVGTVLCGWAGVKGLSGKAVFPISGKDLFPKGAIKLNGIKFYSERDPDMIVSYTSSLILKAESGLIPVFQQLMNSRGVVANPVYHFQVYEGGGISGDVCGESVLLGSNEFLQSMGVHIPEGSMVSQAVYAAIDGELSAVIAVSFAKMRSAAAGIVTLCGYRKLTPVFTGGDFVMTENFIRSKFEVRTHRLLFPGTEEQMALSAKQAPDELSSLTISTRPDLISFAYAVTGARSLRTSCRWGMALHLIGGILGLIIMLVMAITGSTYLLTPVNILLYQLVWMVPGSLVTEWTRHV